MKTRTKGSAFFLFCDLLAIKKLLWWRGYSRFLQSGNRIPNGLFKLKGDPMNSGISKSAIWCGAFASLVWMLSSPVPTHAQGLFIYPNKGQSQQQLGRDRYECHSWAVQQTGFDPSKPAPATSSSASMPPPPPQEQPQGGAFRGAARGAALGAVGGAIGGDAGKGAAIGAGVGALFGGMRRRSQMLRQQEANRRYQEQVAAAQRQQPAAGGQQRNAYNRAMGACLESRGYTVR